MAIEAWTKAEKETDTLHTIHLHREGCRITKRTGVQNSTEDFIYGTEVASDTKVKGQQKKVVVTSKHAAHIIVKTQLPLKNGVIARTVDTRECIEKGAIMHQVLMATNVKTRQEVTIRRFYTKTALPQENED